MRRSLRCWLAAVALLLSPLACAGGWISGEVVSVSDGDTLTVLNNERRQFRIRLAWIDAPEGGMPHGRAARQALARRVFRHQVQVRVVDRDRYGRLVGVVVLGQQDINRLLLEDGYAWHYAWYARQSQSAAEFDDYASAEASARAAERGLWRDAQPQPPWEWRRQRRESAR